MKRIQYGFVLMVMAGAMDWMAPVRAVAQVENVKKARVLYKQAYQAYGEKQYEICLEKFQRAHKLRPTHPGIMYNLASMHALLGNERQAFHWLNRVADMGIYLLLTKDDDFSLLKDRDAFKSVVARFEKNMAPVGNSTRAFKLSEKDLITESVAFDERQNTFYVSSIHKRKIVQITADGVTSDFITAEQDGVWSVFGLRVDAVRRVLWVCTAAVREMQHFQAGEKGRAAVFKYDLDAKKLLKKYAVADTTAAHLFGDLTLDATGNVYISDSDYNGIYRITQKDDRLTEFVAPGWFSSLQGLAFTADAAWLFVADYAQGVFRIDMSTKQVLKLPIPPKVTQLGIDGLYFFDGSLIAIQNGVTPQRVIRIYLNDALDRVVGTKVMEANHPDFDEPTLGGIVGKTFYYVANSQWRRFDKEGHIFSLDKLAEPVILKTRLD
ncbi:MAG: hypothetical protein ACE5HS_19925 [bacterium]